jgi:predicted transcriptional regulator of viral defense system
MSTGYSDAKSTKILNLNRFAELAKLGEVVFHVDDLANLWQIRNMNTLYTTLKRYTKKRFLYRIHKGFYSIKPPESVDPLLLGLKALHSFAYVSTETILAEEGILQQMVPAITLVSGSNKKFTVGGRAYHSRQLADKFLYQSQGISALPSGVRKASRARAIADLLYFNPHAYFDGERLIDWREVRALQESIGYPLTPQRYG